MQSVRLIVGRSIDRLPEEGRMRNLEEEGSAKECEKMLGSKFLADKDRLVIDPVVEDIVA